MARVGLIMAAVAFIVVALTSLIPLVGAFLVAPLAALAIGAGAGWWASKVLGGGSAGRGAGAGAITGVGALFGSVVGLALLAAMFGNSVGNNPDFQQQLQQGIEDAQEQNPDPQAPDIEIPEISGGAVTGAAGVVGAVGGFCFGLVDLLLAVLGGLLGGFIYGRNNPVMATAAPMGYPSSSPPGGHIPAMGSTTRMTESEGGTRIYSDEQPRE